MAEIATPARVYGLSFVSPQRRPRKRPELVFMVSNGYADETRRLLMSARVRQHLQLPRGESWNGGGQLILGTLTERKFGVNDCGYLEEDEYETRYRIPLTDSASEAIALTSCALLFVLNYLVAKQCSDDVPSSNHVQLLNAEVSHGSGLHGNPLGGTVFPAMREWLSALAQHKSKTSAFPWTGFIPMPSVIMAMRSAWKALAPLEMKRWDDDCNALISETGRFSLMCFGNACDVSIYPDQDSFRDSGFPVRFGCHNLDSSIQQITLLAGLAALHDLAAKEMEQN